MTATDFRTAEAFGGPSLALERDALRRVHPAGGQTRDENAPAVREVDALHAKAAAAHASDVHVEPERRGGRIRYRVDGILREMQALSPDVYAQVVSRIKLLAGMDIADKRQPQDGRYAIEADGRSIDARVSSVPTIDGEKIVIRLLDDHAAIPTLSSLAMPRACADRFRRAVHAPHGFIIVCGPTGSGKTTTLYAAMSERNSESQNLCSVEDPVEVRIPGVAQVQVNPRAGVTFASAVRAFLRQDPNVIMVGEMRDEETASVAASASLSGQLVMTTLHSNDAPRSIDRLLELGVARHTIAAGLTAIVAQRLVRRLCRHCKTAVAAAPLFANCLGIAAGTQVYEPRGCASCRDSGYSGRAALFEVMFVEDSLRTLIGSGGAGVDLRGAAWELGYRPMVEDGARRVMAGETSLAEIERVLSLDGAK